MRFKQLPYGVYFNIVLFLIVLFLAAGGIEIFRNILLQHSRSTGMTLANTYAAEERSNLAVYETLLSFGTASIDRRLESGDPQDMQQWMSVFFDRLQTVLGKDSVRPYIVLDGKLLDMRGDLPANKMTQMHPEDRTWYKDAVKSPGKAVFSGVYNDLVTGFPVITVARKCLHSNVVLVFDVFPDKTHSHFMPQSNELRNSLFLCDAAGTILYRHTALKHPEEIVQAYVRELLRKIKNGDFETYTSFVEDLDGNKRAVYYAQMPNGWYSIVTVPYSDILEEADQLFYILIFSLSLVLAVVIFHSLRTIRANALVKRTNETVRVLGNSYYALYRVNIGLNTYEAIKGSDYVRKQLAMQGCYEELLDVIAEFIEPASVDEFRRCFSPESIRNLIAQRIRDFGSNFRRRFGDEYRWVSVRVLYDESLAPEEVVLCFREIEQEVQRQLQERQLLQMSLDHAQLSEQAKQSFFRNMSHEMRTPINAIIGLCELAQKSLDDRKKTLGYLGRIWFSSRQLKSLIDDILNIARMEQGKFALNNKEINLEECIRECIDTYQVQADMERKVLQTDISIEHPWITGDAARILQILNNLLSNAFKFTAEKDVISFSVTEIREPHAGNTENVHADNGSAPVQENNLVAYKFVIADTGIGISREFLPKLFEPYSRETRFSSRQIAGTGLGMPIAKSLVEQMNGEIQVASELGKGTTFTLVIPFTIAQAASPKEQRQQKKQDITFLQGKRILLAEDNMVNMDLAEEMLAMNGMTVSKAWNGREAVELFASSEPFFFHAILMDMQMPEMDGCEAAKTIRAMNRQDAKQIPIIAVTANAFAEDIASTISSGMNAHVSKPIDFKHLFQVLAKYIQNACYPAI